VSNAIDVRRQIRFEEATFAVERIREATISLYSLSPKIGCDTKISDLCQELRTTGRWQDEILAKSLEDAIYLLRIKVDLLR